MNYSDLLTALDQASSFDLFRLREAINVMLDEPDRVLSVKRHLSVGQSIEYFEPEENRLICAIILKLNRTRTLVANKDDGRKWTIPYYFINLSGVDVNIKQSQGTIGLNKNEVKVGDVVGFRNSRTGEDIYGEIIRRNQKTVTLATKSDGQWRVCYSNLFSVFDQAQKDVERLSNNSDI